MGDFLCSTDPPGVRTCNAKIEEKITPDMWVRYQHQLIVQLSGAQICKRARASKKHFDTHVREFSRERTRSLIKIPQACEAITERCWLTVLMEFEVLNPTQVPQRRALMQIC